MFRLFQTNLDIFNKVILYFRIIRRLKPVCNPGEVDHHTTEGHPIGSQNQGGRSLDIHFFS